jgi:hypothetical protein
MTLLLLHTRDHKARIAKFVKGFDRANQLDGNVEEDKIKDIYENYTKLHPHSTKTNGESTNPFHSSTSNNANNTSGHTSIFGKKDNKYQHLRRAKNANDSDYMAMNEPRGPELKYHQLKRLRNKARDEAEANAKAQQEQINKPLPPRVQNKYSQPQFNEYDPQPFVKYQHKIEENITKTDTSTDPQGPDEELEELFKHNSERLDQFIRDRGKYGDYYGSAKIEDDESAKKEKDIEAEKQREQEKQKQKMKEKKDPTPEDVDRNARKYIKQFIFKIHPDFFHQDPAKKASSIYEFSFLYFCCIL